MSGLSKKDVKHVAGLAGLKLASEEVKKFQGQLAEVLEYMKELEEVDVEGVEPTSQTTGLKNVFRQDEVELKGALELDEALSGTEKVHNGYFVVPALIDKKK